MTPRDREVRSQVDRYCMLIGTALCLYAFGAAGGLGIALIAFATKAWPE